MPSGLIANSYSHKLTSAWNRVNIRGTDGKGDAVAGGLLVKNTIENQGDYPDDISKYGIRGNSEMVMDR